jgi:hypothetical protein
MFRVKTTRFPGEGGAWRSESIATIARWPEAISVQEIRHVHPWPVLAGIASGQWSRAGITSVWSTLVEMTGAYAGIPKRWLCCKTGLKSNTATCGEVTRTAA